MQTSVAVVIWWIALCIVSVFNFGLWFYARHRLRRQALSPEMHSVRHRLLVFSFVYVLVCAFRSFLPRADVQQIVLVDSPLSSIEIGRTVATIAELCFAAQWSIVVGVYARAKKSKVALGVSVLIVPIIFVAECFSWYAVLTQNFIGNTIEQSLWTFVSWLVMVSMASLWFKARTQHVFLGTVLAFAAAFVLFMSMIDIPMYFHRWQLDEASGKSYISFREAIANLGLHWRVTFAWEDWREELAWMAFYFSTAVWCSIGLVHFPEPAKVS